MTLRQWTAQFVAAPLTAGPALAAVLALGGCGTVGLFGEYEVAESPEVADAPYPRLVDVPDAPPPGDYSEAVPDPALGYAAETDLAAAAARAEARAAALRQPVISEAERAALLARARRGR